MRVNSVEGCATGEITDFEINLRDRFSPTNIRAGTCPKQMKLTGATAFVKALSNGRIGLIAEPLVRDQ